ncbi:MAG: hypothetical protein SNJ53_01350 [Thermodesulfovibrionales bacterium]
MATRGRLYLKAAICPKLIGTPNGMLCESTSCYLKDMRDIDLNMCRNGRYEGCFYYRSSLMQSIIQGKNDMRITAFV